MNLFQTAPIVDQLLEYKYQTKLKQQQGTIDTNIAESKNETAIETTEMETKSAEKRNTESNLFRLGEKVIDKAPEIVGIGVGGYTIGKSINKNDGNKPKGKGGGSSSALSDDDSSRYREVSDQLDKMIGNNKIQDLQESLKQIKNIDYSKFMPQSDVIKNNANMQVVNNSAFSIPDILPIVTTGLGAIGLSLSSLAFM